MVSEVRVYELIVMTPSISEVSEAISAYMNTVDSWFCNFFRKRFIQTRQANKDAQ